MKLFKTTFYPIALTMILSLFILTGLKSWPVASVQPTTHTVVIEGMQFSPKEIQVKKGDIVVWINKDIVPHDITEADKKWTSGLLEPGQKWSRKFISNAPYYCSIHVVMKGNVDVKN